MCLRVITRLVSVMASIESYFSPPPGVIGMQSLNKDAFKQDFTLPAIKVPAKYCSDTLERLKHVVLRYKNSIKRVQDVPGGGNSEVIHYKTSLWTSRFYF